MQTTENATRTTETTPRPLILKGFSATELETLEEYRQQLYISPPGVDSQSVTDTVPTIEEITAEITSNTQLYPSYIEAMIAAGIPREDIEELNNATAFDIKSIRADQTSKIKPDEAPNKHAGITKHWKRLIKTLPDSAHIRSYGDLVMAEYPLGVPYEDENGRVTPPNNVRVVFDLGVNISSRFEGIKIRAMVQERGEDGVSFNTNQRNMPFDNIYFINGGFTMKIAEWLTGRNVLARARPGFRSIKPKIEVLTFTPMGSGFSADILHHELTHIDQFSRADNSRAVIGLESLNESVFLPGSAIAAIFMTNPWTVLPSLMLTLGTYFASRVEGTYYNKGLKSLFGLEKHAFLSQTIYKLLMERHGFDFSTHESTGSVMPLTKEYIRSTNEHLVRDYQPFIWGLIDAVRLKIDKDQKQVALATAMNYSQ